MKAPFESSLISIVRLEDLYPHFSCGQCGYYVDSLVHNCFQNLHVFVLPLKLRFFYIKNIIGEQFKNEIL